MKKILLHLVDLNNQVRRIYKFHLKLKYMFITKIGKTCKIISY